MDRNMIRFVALDQILRHMPGRMVQVPFESGVRSDSLDDDSTDPAGLRVPSHVITYAEGFRHCPPPIIGKRNSRHPGEPATSSLQTEPASAKRHEFYYSEVAHEE